MKFLAFSFVLFNLIGVSPARGSGELAFSVAQKETGFSFRHINGMGGELWILEIVGAGGGLLDYDSDGRMDLWLVQGGQLDRGPHDVLPGDRLFRNVSEGGQLHFVDVTEAAGIKARGYGMGVASADIDLDGDMDVLVTNYGPNQLFLNLGDGRFRDISEESGVAGNAWSVSASFADVDGDGLPDLYVGNYIDFTFANHKRCAATGARFGSPGSFGYRSPGDNPNAQTYCAPKEYAAQSDRLYRNRGGGRFEDVSDSAGIAGSYGAALGVIADDFNGDDRVDFYVANDGVENLLWLNQGGFRFMDDALLSGVAVNGDAAAEGSMGVTASDFDQDGDVDLFMTHLNNETNTLYANVGGGNFDDRTTLAKVALTSKPYTGFGTGWFDADMDGDDDLFVANGAVMHLPDQVAKGVEFPLAQRNQLWRNTGDNTFAEVEGGPAFAHLSVSRGAAFGDVDNDGDIDILVTNNNGPARLYLNQTAGGHWLGLSLSGSEQRPAILGSLVWLHDRTDVRRRIRTDGSYAATHDPRVILGLGDNASDRMVAVQWPDGEVEHFGPLRSDSYHRLVRGTSGP